MAEDEKPRLCCMTKGENGYGFHLHGEKGKSGQYIRKVEAGTAAEVSGLRAGDRVIQVNGENVEKETHHKVVQRIKALEGETRLLVVDRRTDELLRSLRLTATEEMAVRVPAPAPAPAPASTSSSPPGSPPGSPPSPGGKKRENGSVPKQGQGGPGVQGTKPRRSASRAAKKEAATQLEPQTQPPLDPSELVPRMCVLARSEAGYGFNLHSERARPGQYIRSLDAGSPAEHAGLRPQDRLIEVNGVNIEGMRHAEVVAFIKNGGEGTRLLVVDPDTDEHFKTKGVVPTVDHLRDYDGPSISNGSRSPHLNGKFTTHSIRSTQSNQSSQADSTQMADDEGSRLLDAFAEIGLRLSPTAAEEKEKARANRSKKRAPQMDWTMKYKLFSNF
ncbi:Na(+)/H(+) exchange regulatory cofactor NHE-RF2 [Gadus morhua]|uniref:Na(+)/H(+) exchange regulatory cofactor NHE-RF2-like n=1 Tax=Gadus morhua TaxID=8049 RepID=A0A8C4Z257_GADMO|nr:Na(+)/H(+) exchange regulatory cofactor NHE-RF2-like [Gadus morhua]